MANKVQPFTGCVQDITVDGMRITDYDVEQKTNGIDHENADTGCDRKEVCLPNKCENNGICTDLWIEFKCTCHRPFFGKNCHYKYTAGTFGHEETTNSLAIVDILKPDPFASGVDISMFIRTRKKDGFIFYFGTNIVEEQQQPRSFIIGTLTQGNLKVYIRFDETNDNFQVYTVDLSDGFRHFIRVVRMNNSLMVKVNETVSINHEIPSPNEFKGNVLYLGNYPSIR